MGRLTYMRFSSRTPPLVVAALMVLPLASCSLESPIKVTNRPLAEQLDDRTPQTGNEDERIALTEAPETLAFGDLSPSSGLLRMVVTDTDDSASLRAGPGPGYDVIMDLPSNTELLATGSRTGEWMHVIYADFEGWVREQRLDATGGDGEPQFVDADSLGSSPVTYVVAGDAVGVNIRSAPNAAAELVGGASAGSQVVGTGNTEGHWVEIIFDGVTGWASGNYLEPVSASSESATSQ